MNHIAMMMFIPLVLPQQVTDRYSHKSNWKNFEKIYHRPGLRKEQKHVLNKTWNLNKALNINRTLNLNNKMSSYEREYLIPELTDQQKDFFSETLNLNETYFDKLSNYHINATIVSESQYPWIGRLVNSRFSRDPFICTTACIKERLFITAARCLSGLVLQYTRVVYMYTWITPVAFVLPFNETKQQFDDIGFIVGNNDYAGPYYTKDTTQEYASRTTKDFSWLPILDKVKVIGFATLKGQYNMKNNPNYNLTEVEVCINLQYCKSVLTLMNKFEGFAVPCYVPCKPNEFLSGIYPLCDIYLGAEGGVVLNLAENKIIGVATWGVQANRLWSVGFAVANGDVFNRNYLCAVHISSIWHKLLDSPGSFQNACNELLFTPQQ